ncbi:hypothetical protein J8L85_16640 [Maribacter sp. MMG018]|uniref:hypothetical protein n=1 Tax=Maribacter sp. MMG018 TaxID=2822688 RepID=UPI001B37FC51|nr:hypothetical protein [Maribacter sp. MMG018]MBQ4916083.1 hypothetical protein [Maribacter sp. MMG018]
MKLKIIIAAIFTTCISCNTDTTSYKTDLHVSTLKNNILLENATKKPFSRPQKKDNISLTITGKSILRGTAIFKVTDQEGNEIHCESFPAKNLIEPEYRIANSTLQEAHIRDVVKNYFADNTTFIASRQ